MAGVDDDVQDVLVGRVDVEHVHARRGHHHVAGDHVRHADHPLQHHPRLGGDELLVLGVGEGGDQLVGGIGPRVDELDDALEQVALVRSGVLVALVTGARAGMGVWHRGGRE